MAIRVITFDLDNTLWDVEPALRRAEQAQRQWLLRHRPGAIDGLDREELEQLRKQVLNSHPELAHQVSALRKRLLQHLQERAGFDRRAALAGAQRAFAVFLGERQRVVLYVGALEVLQHLAGRYQLGARRVGLRAVWINPAGQRWPYDERPDAQVEHLGQLASAIAAIDV